MKTPEKDPNRVQLERQLMKDLELLREASTRLSLTMHDLQFEDQSEIVTIASELASELITRASVRASPSK